MKYIFTILGVLFFTCLHAQNVNLVWAKNMGGDSPFAIGQSIAVDASGNVYTTGYFRGTADFDPGPGTYNLTSAGYYDIFISKFNASGNFVWAKKMGGASDDVGNSIAVDASGNVYTTGYFYGTADFDPGPGVYNLTSAGIDDIFVSKLDASGNFVWAKNMGGANYDGGHSIAVDALGNVYTTGSFSGTANFDPGPGTHNLTSAGGDDIFVSKLNASGNFVWAKNMGGASNDQGNSITVDTSGNVYTTGYFYGTADFDPGAGTHNLTAAGQDDIFVSKLDASGNFVWAKNMGGASYDDGNSIAVDASGNVYTTGFFSGTTDFDPGPGIYNLTSAGGTDIFVSKLNASGNFVWAKNMGGAADDQGNSITVDASGNVYTTGLFQDIADFDPGPGTSNLTSAGLYDIFVSKLDASGNFVWAKNMGGAAYDAGESIAVDALGNVYTTGYFSGTADFDPGAGTYNLTAAGFYKDFVSKLDASGNFVWAKNMGGAALSNAGGNSIAVDASGNVYTTGYFQGTADFDPGPGTYNLTSTGYQDIFVSKLDASGNFVWAKSMGGGGAFSDVGNSIAVDASGNVYTTGNFWGTVDFDPGPGTHNLTSSGGDDIFVSKLDASGNFVWAKNMGGATNDVGNSIAVDASGNVYTTGQFSGAADFDPGAGTYNLTSAGQGDIFVSKLDASGNFVWAKNMGGGASAFAIGQSIAVDASGNVYTTGYFGSTVDFDPGAGIYNLTSAGGYDIFVSKLDASGNFVWAKNMGGGGASAFAIGQSIAVDASGNVYTTGYFQGTADFDPGAGIYNLTSAGGTDIFVSKLNASGNFVWAKNMGGASYDYGWSIAVDASGNVYTTGFFLGTADFDPGPGTYNLTYAGDYDIFVSKLDASGNFVWAKKMGGASADVGISIAVDASFNVYTTGYFSGTVDFDPGPGIYNLTSAGTTDIFVVKLSQTAALPVTWLNFNGVLRNNETYLSWSTANEFNSKGFLVQKSMDGQTFAGIGFVKGAGNSSITNNYSYTDAKVQSGTNYYRLKQIDLDGRFSYSSVIQIAYSNFKWAILGNPVTNNSWVQLQLDKTANVSLQVISINGEIIKTINKGIIAAGTYSIQLNLPGTTTNMYVVKLVVNGETFSKKIIK